jgi:O-antigen/teichoic acid export membrane protein
MSLKLHLSLYLAPSIIRGVIVLAVIVPLITGYLEATDFGVVALVSAVIGILASFSSISPAWVLGAAYYNVEYSEYKKIVFTCAVIEFLLRVVMGVLAISFASYFLPFIFEPLDEVYYFYFTIALIAFCADSFWPLISSMLVIEKNAILFSYMELFRISINLLIVIYVLEFVDTKQLAFYMPAAISAFLLMLFTLYLLKSRMTMCFDIKLFKRCFKIGLPSIPGNVSQVLTNSTDNFAVQWFGGGLSQVGLYSHSKAYGGIFLMVTKSFFRVFRSEILNIFSNNSKTEQLQSVISNWLYMFAIAGIGLGLVIEPMLNLLTNGKLTNASLLVIFWYSGMLISFFGYVYTQFLISKEMTLIIMWIQIVTNTLSLLLLFSGGFLFGIYGVAVGAIVGMFLNQMARSVFSQGRGCEVKLLKPLLLSLILVVATNGLIELSSPDLLIRLIFFSIVIIFLTIILFRKIIPESENFAKLTSNAGIGTVK